MSDSTRAHKRVREQAVPGKRSELSLGGLLVPNSPPPRGGLRLVMHFHGAPWLAEWSVRKALPKAGCLTLQLGSGSGVYAKPFEDENKFGALLDEAAQAAGAPLRSVVLTSFSAGYGAVRQILRHRENWQRIDGILLMDSLHTGYQSGDTPGPLEEPPMEPFVDFGLVAAAGRKHFLVTHSEIFPGTFASTTETADLLIRKLDRRRVPVLRWGPLGMQQLSDVHAGKFKLMGFAGNTAPDHVDHFHAMSDWLRQMKL